MRFRRTSVLQRPPSWESSNVNDYGGIFWQDFGQSFPRKGIDPCVGCCRYGFMPVLAQLIDKLRSNETGTTDHYYFIIVFFKWTRDSGNQAAPMATFWVTWERAYSSSFRASLLNLRMPSANLSCRHRILIVYRAERFLAEMQCSPLLALAVAGSSLRSTAPSVCYRLISRG